MNRDDYVKFNYEAWNEVAEKHKAGDWDKRVKKFLTKGFSSLDNNESRVLSQIGLKDKAVAHLCCNSGKELLSIKNLGAKTCIGFDISEKFIEQAKDLAKLSGIECEFVNTDVYKIDPKYFGMFDLVYISVGTFGWMPDLKKFCEIIRNLLRPGGDLLVYETHPFLDMLGTEVSDGNKIIYSYFMKKPIVDDLSLDYIGKTSYAGKRKYWFHHQISEIITTLIENNLEITRFEEYADDLSAVFDHLSNIEPQIPMSYLLSAKKKI